MQLHVPDANGMHGDVVLGKATIQEYITPSPSPFFGCLVGRFGNRIRGGQFTLDGERSVVYGLGKRSGAHVIWTAIK
jgi:aldose 1-epimerase